MSRFLLLVLLLIATVSRYAGGQNYPWQSPLKMAFSNDGTFFHPPSVFQDSAGVPSLIRWRGDTLVCAFQWFRQPVASPTWDRVAVKFSYDAGVTWTEPVPIVVSGLPAGYQRPFDPTLVVFNSDSLRIYFSSSSGISAAGLDSTVNTYSAKSHDGIHNSFEAGTRVDEAANRVIDPAVIRFNQAWHYLSPIGSPQQGAYHYVSPDGINFSRVPDIPSDSMHNWTGNYLVNDTGELRFYGCGQSPIWFCTSPNGGFWTVATPTNIMGGDPSVLRISAQQYLMVLVGPPAANGIIVPEDNPMLLFPNPAGSYLTVEFRDGEAPAAYTLFNAWGIKIREGILGFSSSVLDVSDLPSGVYFIHSKGIRLRWQKK